MLLPQHTHQLVVSQDELAFYKAVARYRGGLEVVTAPTSESIVVTRAARTQVGGYTITQIITSSLTNDSDRLYVMQRPQ
jgi:hypothetical protein